MAVDFNKFKTAPLAIASYDYFDLATNQSFKDFYGSVDVDLNATLSGNNSESNYLYSEGGTTERNFDYVFGVPLVLSGKLLITATVDTISAGSGGATTSASFRVLKVNLADAETELLGTMTTNTCGGASVSQSRRVVVGGEISETIFKPGEKLRIEAIINAGGSAVSFRLYHDPVNRGIPSNDAVTGVPPATTLKVTIPFKTQQ